MPKAKPITISVPTVAECCELLDFDVRHWARLIKDKIVFQDANGHPDFARSCPSYIKFIRDGESAAAKDVTRRTKEAEMRTAEREDAEGANLLVPASDYQTNYTEARDKICRAVSNSKTLSDDAKNEVITIMQNVKLEPLEFASELTDEELCAGRPETKIKEKKFGI